MRLPLQQFLLSWMVLIMFVWSQILEIYITSRKKKGYIIGRKITLAEDNPNYDEWEAKNALVKSWPINSMTNKLISHFV